jgi:hypothetical protein
MQPQTAASFNKTVGLTFMKYAEAAKRAALSADEHAKSNFCSRCVWKTLLNANKSFLM